MEMIDEGMPVRDSLRQVWFNLFRFAVEHPDYAQFSEQFSNSPYNNQVDQRDIDRMFSPLIKLVMHGIKRKILKDVNVDIINTFILYPVSILANSRLCRNFDSRSETDVEQAFQLAWDAIKL
jgi:predicted lipoprotein